MATKDEPTSSLESPVERCQQLQKILKDLNPSLTFSPVEKQTMNRNLEEVVSSLKVLLSKAKESDVESILSSIVTLLLELPLNQDESKTLISNFSSSLADSATDKLAPICSKVVKNLHDGLSENLEIQYIVFSAMIKLSTKTRNYSEVLSNLTNMKASVEKGGDWDRRNRLKVYLGIYSMAIRNFKEAANLLLDTISTFTCYELTDYKTFVGYTVISAMLALPRTELRTKVIKSSVILENLHDLPDLQEFLFSLYNCQYGKFFEKLAWIETYLKTDPYLAPHYRYYVREMRILAYNQLIGSYRSLSLTYMSQTFEVSVDFIEAELAKFIAAGRLHCKIDRVRCIVETNRPDFKNDQYQRCIKQGDILLNRIQKLSRVINV